MTSSWIPCVNPTPTQIDSASQQGQRQRRRPPLKYRLKEAKKNADPKVEEEEEEEEELSQRLRDLFILSHQDDETTKWLQSTYAPSEFKKTLADMMRLFISRTSANGITHRGGMFVVSRAQFVRLLNRAVDGVREADRQKDEAEEAADVMRGRYQLPAAAALSGGGASVVEDDDTANLIAAEQQPSAISGRRLLDIGAGDGGVTRVLAPFFSGVAVTEDNTVMRQRLRFQFGFSSVFSSAETTELLARGENDVIACLNVLDRCDRPLTLLRDIRRGLLERAKSNSKSAGDKGQRARPPLLLLAVVLPWCPFVEDNAKQRPPTEQLTAQMAGGFCRQGASFEKSFDRLVRRVLEPAGFRLRAWTRVPYFSEGDGMFEYFALDDSLMVLEAVEGEDSE